MSITVAIPVYNAEKYLKLAISSVLNQTFADFELIILDDGSTDASMKIAKSFEDERIRIVSDGRNLGLPARLNQVVELAKYDLIARMDADDIIPLDRLKKQYEYLSNHPGKDLVSTGLAYIDDNQVLGVSIPQPPKQLTLIDMLNGAHGICHASLLVRKPWYQRNKYDANMHRVEDFELWLRAYLSKDLNVGYLSYIGYYYRSDTTLNVSKYVNTFKGGLIIANKHNLGIKYKLKSYLKILASKLIFAFGLESKLLSKLNGKGVNDEVKLEFTKLISRLSR
ncbi:glycosyltransferase family 2 protein [Vibrio sp. 10N.222.55.A3]|uniref:glycosyltransferase family 2 protein n=1 Tax=unclassified Vibrio TaxID=2614977 RepID=UPI001E514057|nr:glycosyltransferase family 2 protein [Vibrio sp. F13]MCC4892279.1 glycosyltransferase family 2 protein [Vibrio sp. F13]